MPGRVGQPAPRVQCRLQQPALCGPQFVGERVVIPLTARRGEGPPNDQDDDRQHDKRPCDRLDRHGDIHEARCEIVELLFNRCHSNTTNSRGMPPAVCPLVRREIVNGLAAAGRCHATNQADDQTDEAEHEPGPHQHLERRERGAGSGRQQTDDDIHHATEERRDLRENPSDVECWIASFV
jgi:hypothetical protein